ncbi:MAG: hypothetical protein ACK4UJ_06765 [Leptonema sp. (in: bacteria)]
MVAFPLKVTLEHNLSRIDKNIHWEKENQSIFILKEEIIFYFFSQSKRNQIFNKDYKMETKKTNILKIENCKEINDFTLEKFLWLRNPTKKWESLEIELNEVKELSLWLLKNCNNSYIQENAKNLLYWQSLYEEYKN